MKIIWHLIVKEIRLYIYADGDTIVYELYIKAL
jgi:hypothetical protein